MEPTPTQPQQPLNQESSRLFYQLREQCMGMLATIKAKFLEYKEQKQRSKMQKIQLDVNKQQWGEGSPQEQGKTTNIAPAKPALPAKPPKVEGLH